MRLKRRVGAALAAAAIIFSGTMPANVRGQEYVEPTPESAPAIGSAGVVKHVIVIFQENVSFDHYFGTYPVAANLAGESKFTAKPGTPSVNGLTPSLMGKNNPNSTPPFRLSRAQVSTCDENHNYMPEQMAFDFGLMDKFPESVGVGPCKGASSGTNSDYGHGTGLVMGYFDGSTTTAMWNYSQTYALSDNFFQTQFGPSTPGHLLLISGNTNGATKPDPTGNAVLNGTVIGDPQPDGDICSSRDTSAMSGKNVGDLLNAKNITWGFFQGGFDLTKGGCLQGHTSKYTMIFKKDYIAHHQPFQYYKSTQNLNHTRPSSTAMIGKTDPANHQYDINDFMTAVSAGHMPAVAYLKAPGYQDGHPSYSTPLDEQFFVVNMINFLEARPEWTSTVIFISWDDSDGWYDHQMSPILIDSASTQDALSGPGRCGNHAGTIQGRCGYGMRIPLIAISPFAKANFVDHTTTDFTSILKFVEDTFALGRIGGNSLDAQATPLSNMFDFAHPNPNNKLHLDPNSGMVM